MKVASSLIFARHPGPDVAEAAVHAALAKAGLARAEQVILFLSHDFSRHLQPAILAAARAAGTTQVSGCTSHGVFTEANWQIDQTAAAALVLGPSDHDNILNDTILSLSGNSTLPADWQNGLPRGGMIDPHAAVWHHGRVAATGTAELSFPGLSCQLALSTGLRNLAPPQSVDNVESYELHRVDNHRALDSLIRALPPELREYPPLHHLAIQRAAGTPGVAILSANADGSLTLAAELDQGELIQWAIRQPMSAEQDMRHALTATVDGQKMPNFGLMFSCVGRGPLFYGDDDRDLLCFREQFLGVPLLGAYSSGQIAPDAGKNYLFNNAAVTLLFESTHV